ncbi:MAG: NAD-dependent epimerase/dehydratase family protein [Thermodesulfobacteriota bacterium]|nr:NAD-dependent epimerase/dehydratase family protein [Thermodesulfobacteriota bacterium]
MVEETTAHPRHWLITGGCGFIGTNLISHLLCQHSARIRVLDDLSTGTREGLAEACEFVEMDRTGLQAPSSSHGRVHLIVGDIRDDETCLLCSEGVDVAMPLAAKGVLAVVSFLRFSVLRRNPKVSPL